MQVPGVSISDMFMRVRAAVMKQTGNKQVPWEASSLVGAFYFSAPKSAAESATESKFDSAAFELSYWETIKNSTYAQDFKAYLEKYPNGQFAALAKNRIGSLDASTKPVESKSASSDSATELAFWDSVKNSNRIEDFQAYLKTYPNGAFTELASNRVASLETAAREKEKVETVKKSSLEGSTWRGSSPGGDKVYEFQFLPNGEYVFYWKKGKTLKSGDYKYPNKGRWGQTGNTIVMTAYTGSMEATISEDKMIGTWDSWKFTLERVP